VLLIVCSAGFWNYQAVDAEYDHHGLPWCKSDSNGQLIRCFISFRLRLVSQIFSLDAFFRSSLNQFRSVDLVDFVLGISTLWDFVPLPEFGGAKTFSTDQFLFASSGRTRFSSHFA